MAIVYFNMCVCKCERKNVWNGSIYDIITWTTHEVWDLRLKTGGLDRPRCTTHLPLHQMLKHVTIIFWLNSVWPRYIFICAVYCNIWLDICTMLQLEMNKWYAPSCIHQSTAQEKKRVAFIIYKCCDMHWNHFQIICGRPQIITNTLHTCILHLFINKYIWMAKHIQSCN